MGSSMSCLKSKKDPEKKKKATGTAASPTAAQEPVIAENHTDLAESERRSGSLQIPVPPPEAHSPVRESSRQRSITVPHDAAVRAPSTSCPVELQSILDYMSDPASSLSTSSSAPQLFRISPTTRDEVEPGTWAWWRQELRRERVTKDGYSKGQLRDVANRLTYQHDENPESVELDFSNSYMERAAPYVLGRLLASTQLKELRWITSLRLDGNYFTDDGFGKMLALISAENEQQTTFPLLRQLYFNSMNLDRSSVAGLFAYFFPINRKATRGVEPKAALRVANSRVARPSEAFFPLSRHGPKVPLFPSLTVLSLSDNPGLGTAGLIQILRSLLAVHYEPNLISVIDLSRCGIDRAAAHFFKQYFDQLPAAIEAGYYPVVPRRFVLMGNPHGITDPRAIYSPERINVQLVL